MADMRKGSVDEIDVKKEAIGEVHHVEVNSAGAALAAATEAQKPSMVSPGMTKLWLIVGIGKFWNDAHVLDETDLQTRISHQVILNPQAIAISS